MASRRLEFRARQHEALGRVGVDQVEDWRDIVHRRLADRQPPFDRGRFRKSVAYSPLIM